MATNDPKAQGTSGWTVETLYVHFEQRMSAAEEKNQQQFSDQEKAVQTTLAATKEAINKAETNAEKWRDNANEWRGAMNDREKNFAPLQRVEALEKRFENREGIGKGLKDSWGYLVGAIGILLAIGSIVMRLAGK